MKLTQSQLAIGIMVLGILVLAGVWLWLSTQSAPKVGVSLAKQFASDFHESLQTERELNEFFLQDFDDLQAPTEDRDAFFLLQNVGRAYQREIEWLSEKENIQFDILSKTENNWQAQTALQNEIGYYFLFSYMQAINQESVDAVSRPDFDIEQTIQNTEQELSQLLAKGFLPVSILNDLAKESGLTPEQVQDGVQHALTEFLEFKKDDFAQSVTRYEKAVVGHQLLSWRFLLETLSSPSI